MISYHKNGTVPEGIARVVLDMPVNVRLLRLAVAFGGGKRGTPEGGSVRVFNHDGSHWCRVSDGSHIIELRAPGRVIHWCPDAEAPVTPGPVSITLLGSVASDLPYEEYHARYPQT